MQRARPEVQAALPVAAVAVKERPVDALRVEADLHVVQHEVEGSVVHSAQTCLITSGQQLATDLTKAQQNSKKKALGK